MAPPRDPRVTDLRRYRRERERARRAAPKPAAGPNESFLGARPRAGLILILAVVVLAVMAYLQVRR
ncbi:MAG: hypothetical protein E7812_14580 [Phenylobacterium sp.]|nr:MAG: hypothetical protein E7812_14580 [Phenylobacterium sp.]